MRSEICSICVLERDADENDAADSGKYIFYITENLGNDKMHPSLILGAFSLKGIIQIYVFRLVLEIPLLPA